MKLTFNTNGQNHLSFCSSVSFLMSLVLKVKQMKYSVKSRLDLQGIFNDCINAQQKMNIFTFFFRYSKLVIFYEIFYKQKCGKLKKLYH